MVLFSYLMKRLKTMDNSLAKRDMESFGKRIAFNDSGKGYGIEIKLAHSKIHAS